MKVLFAVNNEKISEAIVKKYQTMYKEIISWKNVYFFNAIIKELQKDKSYDRIVIGEDLEPYANNNYEVIDNFIFDKLDSISDEAADAKDGGIPVVLIATDRREKGDSILVKMFGIGIYNVLLGKDRSMENVCNLIAQPRNKKEAKAYYNIEVDDVDYQSTDPDSVSEVEIQNIIRHYKKLGKNEDKYVESFNDIAVQYTDTQLKLITKFLPLNVRAVLEERSPKYQQVMIGSVRGQLDAERRREENSYTAKDIDRTKDNKIDLIENELKKSKLTKPVVIPSAINMQNVKKAYSGDQNDVLENTIIPVKAAQTEKNTNADEELEKRLEGLLDIETENKEEQNVEPVKKGRGRPKKERTAEEIEAEANKEKRGRGRPKKVIAEPIEENQNEEVDLFNLANEDNKQEVSQQEPILPGFEDTTLPGLEDSALPEVDELPKAEKTEPLPNVAKRNEAYNNSNQYSITNDLYSNTQMEKATPKYDNSNLFRLLTGDKKAVAFVGTSKNGTSFLVNNLAALLSSKGINTAILDLTKNKNSYYIYTLNEEQLRNKAFACIDGLRRGVAEGIQVNKNLSVYTTVPGDEIQFEDYGNILETLIKNYSLVLLDCDFDTNMNYFSGIQEIYLVQTYDILTIQPLTAFLNELKHKDILDESKLRIVINKTLPLRKLTDRMIIGGISCYNDPASTFINTLFNKDTVKYTSIPFENQTYARYLERLVDCEISLNGYSKTFLDALNKLSNMVYPLIAEKNKYQPKQNYNDYSKKATPFNSNMDATLNKMRKNF